MKIADIIRKDDGNPGSPSRIAPPSFIGKGTDPETEKHLRSLLSDPARLNGSDDREIKRLYGLLKEDAGKEVTRKRRFGKMRAHVKRMVRLDARRTNLRYVRRAGKYLAVLAFIAAPFLCILTGYRPYLATDISDVSAVLEYDLRELQNAPEVAICFLIFLLGVLMYIGARVSTSDLDRRLTRRIVCKAAAEGLSVTEIIRLKDSVFDIGIGDISEFHPLKELCQPDGDREDR